MRHTAYLMLAGAMLLATPVFAADVPANVAAAVADKARPEADTVRDANRKPADMLAFGEVKKGDVVIDMIPGGGYFTRLFSAAVGPKGKVYAFIPNPADGSAPRPPSESWLALTKDAHYSNVEEVRTTVDKLATAKKADLAWTSQNYHDVHGARLGGQAGVDALNKSVFNALKPGGIYIVLDHASAPGKGLADIDTTHRIDPETVKAEVKAVGFEYVGESDVLRNKDDNHTIKVYDASIRGKTDQFILKFRKPK